jgi:YggT family protein
MLLLAQIVQFFFQVCFIILIVQALLSWFMDPYHPVRRTIDRFVEPFLVPIRRFMPRTGMFDFSPLVLLIILWILDRLLVSLILSFAN